LIELRIATGELTPRPLQLGHGDVCPQGAPDGVINLSDVLVLRGRMLP
jgi:hypothetical protein